MLELSLQISNKPTKKYMVVFKNPNSNRLKSIHFGSKKFEDYTTHHDKKRKANYIKRHATREDWTVLNPGSLSRWLLWEHESLADGVKAFNQNVTDAKITEISV